MVRVQFTRNVQRHLACPPGDVAGATVREVLDAVFAANEPARGYFLDERGALRTHIVVFVKGRPVRDRAGLLDCVPDGAEVFVMQALSGG